ncbi:sulfatase family protein [Jiulongibacter sediminis]|uniref:Arylsulfatase n=1 Tax=Jiulongibacter sediminis TaxID=1605367 RepID=A0A0P7C1B1_9BACT|nr:arylsulfatase [Jiulongibacter sediminis]KPM47774.1 arylsulfatase [Jiulongibacter sediminis]TBX23958.1 arylsulfatase [Jiulongibacter sediminis]
MKSFKVPFSLPLFLLVVVFSCQKKEETKPNIIYILADDLGIGDVSAFNDSSLIKTTNIDRLATEGVRFTDAHSGSAVCTPTRYGILTGRYSWRGVLKKGVTWSYDTCIVEPGRLTVGTLLQTAGYETASIGKWHLGMNWTKADTGSIPVDFSQKLNPSPNSYGFDYFFGIPASLDIPPYVYVENDEVTALPNRMTQDTSAFGWWRLGPTGADFTHQEVLPTFFEKARSFISQKRDKPFFLYLPLSAPHTPILPDENNKGQSGLNEYADFVLMIDGLVGQLMNELEKQGLDSNTMIVFASDNGCAPYADVEGLEEKGHRPSMNFRGYKADIYEGGHRIPLIIKWKGHFEAGKVVDATNCLTDFMATVADLNGVKIPENTAEDSFSLLPLLTGQGEFLRKNTIHHSVDGNFAIRQGDWKLIMAPGSGGWSYPRAGKEPKDAPKVQLFNLKSDSGERENLVEKEKEQYEFLRSQLQQVIKNGRSNEGPAQEYVNVENWPGMNWTMEL